MWKKLFKYLSPFELVLVVSMLVILFISLIIYIDKKSNEKLKFFVYKTQEKSILRLISQIEDELARQDSFLNKIYFNYNSKLDHLSGNLLIFENGEILFSNVDSNKNYVIKNAITKSQGVFFASDNDISILGSYILKDGRIFATFVNLEKIIKESIFGENILINFRDGSIVHASEYKDFFNIIRRDLTNRQFSVINGGEEIAITSVKFYDDFIISIYAPFKYYYSGLVDKDVRIGVPAFIFGVVILSLLFIIKMSVNRFVSEKEKYEKLFQLEHEKFQKIVQSIDEGVNLISSDYDILWGNDYITKKLPDIKVGKCYHELTGLNNRCSFCMLDKVFNEKKTQSITTKDFLKGYPGFYDVIWVPLLDEKGEVTSCVEIIRDITPIVEMQNKIIQSEKLSALGLLAGGVAHEINNPLVGILNMSQLLARRFEEKSKERGMIDLIIEAGKETKNIVQSLLDYSRQGSEKMEKFDIRESINFAIKIFGSRIKDKKIIVENRIDSPIFVKASKGKMHQVFINLIGNSIDAIESNGRIILESESSDEVTKIKVIDNGKGIKKEDADKVFDPFFTTKEVGKGTGLGLSITQGIINDLGWSISFQSEPDRFTCFEIKIVNSRSLEAHDG